MSTDAARVAIVQRPPVLLDRDATIRVVVDAIDEVAAAGASLAVFPEAFIPGYPLWIWKLRPGGDYRLASELHAQLLANSVDLTTEEMTPIRDAAARRGVVVVCGIHEREGSFSRATLYDTLVTIGADGTVLNRHRKLMPTNPERMVWGQGDATGLRVVDTPVGRLGGLICWESYMPLARYALYAEGVQLYVASTWDSGAGWLASMRHIAQEGRCWVLGSGFALNSGDIPATVPHAETLFATAEEWVNSGDSVVIAPSGETVAGPLHDKYDILYADIDATMSSNEHRTLDVAGHYGRPDIFTLTVDRSPRNPIDFR